MTRQRKIYKRGDILTLRIRNDDIATAINQHDNVSAFVHDAIAHFSQQSSQNHSNQDPGIDLDLLVKMLQPVIRSIIEDVLSDAQLSMNSEVSATSNDDSEEIKSTLEMLADFG